MKVSMDRKVEYRDIVNARSKVNVLELELLKAQKTVSLLESDYIKENAKYKVGDRVQKITEPEDKFYIFSHYIREGGSLVYIGVGNNHNRILLDEKDIEKIEA